jgi:hypothetical protein
VATFDDLRNLLEPLPLFELFWLATEVSVEVSQ